MAADFEETQPFGHHVPEDTGFSSQNHEDEALQDDFLDSGFSMQCEGVSISSLSSNLVQDGVCVHIPRDATRNEIIRAAMAFGAHYAVSAGKPVDFSQVDIQTSC
jgi:hypothetical protein